MDGQDSTTADDDTIEDSPPPSPRGKRPAKVSNQFGDGTGGTLASLSVPKLDRQKSQSNKPFKKRQLILTEGHDNNPPHTKLTTRPLSKQIPPEDFHKDLNMGTCKQQHIIDSSLKPSRSSTACLSTFKEHGITSFSPEMIPYKRPKQLLAQIIPAAVDDAPEDKMLQPQLSTNTLTKQNKNAHVYLVSNATYSYSPEMIPLKSAVRAKSLTDINPATPTSFAPARTPKHHAGFLKPINIPNIKIPLSSPATPKQYHSPPESPAEPRSIEAPPYSPITPRPPTSVDSVEAPPYSPLTPRPRNSLLLSPVDQHISSRLRPKRARYEKDKEHFIFSSLPSRSPSPAISLAGMSDILDSDDSVKDPDYDNEDDDCINDSDVTECSDSDDAGLKTQVNSSVLARHDIGCIEERNNKEVKQINFLNEEPEKERHSYQLKPKPARHETDKDNDIFSSLASRSPAISLAGMSDIFNSDDSVKDPDYNDKENCYITDSDVTRCSDDDHVGPKTPGNSSVFASYDNGGIEEINKIEVKENQAPEKARNNVQLQPKRARYESDEDIFSLSASRSPSPEMSRKITGIIDALDCMSSDIFNDDDSVKDTHQPELTTNKQGQRCDIQNSKNISATDYSEENSFDGNRTEANVQEPNIQRRFSVQYAEYEQDENDRVMIDEDLFEQIDEIETSVNVIEEVRDGTVTPESISENACPVRQGRSKKGRKRKQSLTRQQVKYNKYNNLPYVNRKNKKIDCKTFNNYDCKCKNNCPDLIGTGERQAEFKKFNTLGSYEAQLLYIAGNVKQYPKKRMILSAETTSNGGDEEQRKKRPRAYSRTYKLRDVIVCRDMFINTLQITTSKVDIALKKKRNGSGLTDDRGRHTLGWNKISEVEVQFIVNLIDRLPKYVSHYCRGQTEAKYLQPGMTHEKLYSLYKEEFEALPDKENRKCVSQSTFKRIFYENFNLKFKPLKKDTCNKCDAFAISMSNESFDQEIVDARNRHLDMAENSRKKMNDDFQRAKVESTVECLTFDMEKTLPLPRIPTNIVFYKRQLWVYNCGIHSASDDKGYCNIWVEGDAGRGAQEVGSCLFKHIKKHLKEGTEELILWSDSCGGQNRNIKLTLMMKAVLHSHPSLKCVSIRFLEPGHTFLPNDTDFSKIETKLKEHPRIYTPEEYIDIMRNCKKLNPLAVERMHATDFVSSGPIEDIIVNRKVFKSKNKVNWLVTKEILLNRDQEDSVFMRRNFEEDFEEIDIKRRTVKGRPVTNRHIDTNLFVPLWPNGKEIAAAKLDDIKSMMHLIPYDCREFYQNLKGNRDIEDDVDGFGGIPDFDLEEANLDL